MNTLVFLLRSTLGLVGGLVFMWEMNRQASGPGWRKPRVFSAAAVVLLAGLLAV
ncbi:MULTISPECIES: hypothetical protein [Streptomyces]|uniref:hypothetical protein n=1 Tax=Streptomyces TaxID=1883 RepID=UPI00142DBA18|nr:MULTISPECIES: hypothetical protein [Streptomyces]